jgi:lipopolysaccharide heptosyltransferase II
VEFLGNRAGELTAKMLSLSMMKLIDSIIGQILCFLLSPLAKLKRNRPASYPVVADKTLIIKFWGLGSIILIAPTAAKLKSKYPACRIYFLTFENNRDVCDMIPDIDETITIRMNSIFNFARDTISVLWRIRREKFDFVVDLEFFTRFSALISFFSNAKVKAGFHAWETYRGNLHDIRSPFNYYWHVTDSFISLATGQTNSAGTECVKMFVPEHMKRWAGRFLQERPTASEMKIVVVNPNAGELALERRWPAEKFIQLLQILERKDSISVFLIGAASERDYNASILNEAGTERVENLAGCLTIPELAAFFSRADLLISNDSGPLHIACGVGTPTISFFGPETPVLYGPLGNMHRFFFKNISCSPCINIHKAKTVRCRHGNSDCLARISVEEVVSAVEEMLQITNQRSVSRLAKLKNQ